MLKEASCHETFIEERVMNDWIRSVGGTTAIEITKDLLTLCHASH